MVLTESKARTKEHRADQLADRTSPFCKCGWTTCDSGDIHQFDLAWHDLKGFNLEYTKVPSHIKYPFNLGSCAIVPPGDRDTLLKLGSVKIMYA
jgi:hypothetical protein